ncbi:hypothetical protein BKA01_003369 [Pseudonocardia eucalypti]|uniref:SIR2 family protein n=1 Tax=Pseudonocardia eucalypti TaxID=648755 RepID=UPI001621563F|nr:hypothetical protein [Pseudonocardia eucalypti]
MSTPDQKITIICGAGVSKDSGLPSWEELLQRLVRVLDDKDMQEMVVIDRIDPPRKADYIFALRKDRNLAWDSFVRDGLYAGQEANLAPGVLADSLASFVQVVQSRVRIMTTNYDNKLEDALEKRMPEVVVEARGLKQARKWWGTDPMQKIEVLHLHGYVPPGGEPAIGPIVLGESQYLEHGAAVRLEIQKALRESVVLFVGMSLTDPNLSGPLHAVRTGKAFTLMVPDAPEPDLSRARRGALALAYCSAQADSRYRHFGVQTVILKSFGQVAQCIEELSIAADPTTQYSKDTSDLRYGRRFWRILEKVHLALGMTNGNVPAGGDKGREVSEALAEAMVGGPMALINDLRANCRLEYSQMGMTKAHLDEEEFALYLWVRDLGSDPRSPGSFQISLAGTSAYIHRSSVTLQHSVPIAPNSPIAAAEAVYFGNARLIDGAERGKKTQMWGTLQSVPIHMAEIDFDANATSYPVCIGAATLVSNYRVVAREIIENAHATDINVAKAYQPSALSTMCAADFAILTGSVREAARKVIVGLYNSYASLGK